MSAIDENGYPLDDAVVCDRCNGHGNVPCCCSGDFQCWCGQEYKVCPVCHGDVLITKKRYEKRAKIHREIMQAIWGDKAEQSA